MRGQCLAYNITYSTRSITLDAQRKNDEEKNTYTKARSDVSFLFVIRNA